MGFQHRNLIKATCHQTSYTRIPRFHYVKHIMLVSGNFKNILENIRMIKNKAYTIFNLLIIFIFYPFFPAIFMTFSGSAINLILKSKQWLWNYKYTSSIGTRRCPGRNGLPIHFFCAILIPALSH